MSTNVYTHMLTPMSMRMSSHRSHTHPGTRAYAPSRLTRLPKTHAFAYADICLRPCLARTVPSFMPPSCLLQQPYTLISEYVDTTPHLQIASASRGARCAALDLLAMLGPPALVPAPALLRLLLMSPVVQRRPCQCLLSCRMSVVPSCPSRPSC